MKKKEKLSEYRKREFSEPRPSINWLKKQVDNEEIPGTVIGGVYFAYKETTGNDLADQLLEP